MKRNNLYSGLVMPSSCWWSPIQRRHDTRHIDIQYGITRHNDAQHASTQYSYIVTHNNISVRLNVLSFIMLSFIMLSIILLNVFMLSVLMLSVIVLGIIWLYVVMLSIFVLSAIILNSCCIECLNFEIGCAECHGSNSLQSLHIVGSRSGASDSNPSVKLCPFSEMKFQV